jgi:hypothetical protein
MCSGPRKPSSPAPALLLELAAADDLAAFRRAVEEGDGASVGAACHWYGPSAAGGLRLELRTPAMVAALYGSTAVLPYVLSAAPSEASRASPTDGATPLHLAASGAAAGAVGAARLLLAAGAPAFSGLRANSPSGDPLLKSPVVSPSSSPKKPRPPSPPPAPEQRKEYPPDLTLPDLKSGLFSTDEFRMYSFKVKPCSRAYSHDWTECPFVHPGENARRRDPRRYSYTCVPCPDFRKAGACRKGDACEYAHGVFECWLHPAQYRTRLCKDEVGCARRICFFAHKPHELRAVNPSAVSVGMQPNNAAGSSPAGARRARDLDFDLELLAMDQYQHNLSPTPARTMPDYADLLGSVDPALLSQLHALSLKQAADMPPYTSMPDSQLHMPPPASPMAAAANAAFGMDHSMAKAIMTSRASAFAKRSQSFIDRGARARTPSVLSDWGSPDGRLDWGVQGDELNKFRKSASFAFRGQSPTAPVQAAEPDVSWVNSLVRDGGHAGDMFAQWPEQEQMVA